MFLYTKYINECVYLKNPKGDWGAGLNRFEYRQLIRTYTIIMI